MTTKLTEAIYQAIWPEGKVPFSCIDDLPKIKSLVQQIEALTNLNDSVHKECLKCTEDLKSLPQEESLIIEALTGEPERPPGITATDAPKETPSSSKIPHSADEEIYVMHHMEGKTFAAIAKSLNERGLSCANSDVSNRYYATYHKISKKRRDNLKATLPDPSPSPELSKLSIEDARILKMANEGCMVHEICVYVNRNFYANYSTTQMAEKIRNLQARPAAGSA